MGLVRQTSAKIDNHSEGRVSKFFQQGKSTISRRFIPSFVGIAQLVERYLAKV